MSVRPFVPTGWTHASLAELGTLIRGRGGSKADAASAGVPCIRYGDLYTKHDNIVRDIQSFVPPSRAAAYTALLFGDVVFAGSGETPEDIGKAAAFCGTHPAVTSGDTIVLRPGRGADGRFLGYAANSTSANNHKSRMGQGSSVFHISAAHVGQYFLPVPPLPEQRAIATVLDTLDDAIQKTEQIIAKLKQVKQGLLHDLLTRGIDDNGELRDPERHPEQFQDSPLGRIPKGWEVKPLAQVSSKVTDGTHQAVALTDAGESTVPFLYVSCVRDGRIDWGGAGAVPRATYAAISRGREPVAGMILYTAVGSFGHAAVVEEQREFSFQRHIACVYVDQKRSRPAFVSEWLNHPTARAHSERVAIGNAQRTVTLGSLSLFPIPLPRREEQDRIADVLASISRRVVNAQDERRKLLLLKTGLAEDLLTGRVRTTSLGEVAA